MFSLHDILFRTFTNFQKSENPAFKLLQLVNITPNIFLWIGLKYKCRMSTLIIYILSLRCFCNIHLFLSICAKCDNSKYDEYYYVMAVMIFTTAYKCLQQFICHLNIILIGVNSILLIFMLLTFIL